MLAFLFAAFAAALDIEGFVMVDLDTEAGECGVTIDGISGFCGTARVRFTEACDDGRWFVTHGDRRFIATSIPEAVTGCAAFLSAVTDETCDEIEAGYAYM